MYISFTTDAQNTGMGFQARWANSPISGVDVTSVHDVGIYPNPASQTVTVEFHSVSRVKTGISIYSETGQMVQIHQFMAEPGINRQGFDIKDWSEGIYFIRMVNGNRVINRKFVKQ